MNRFHKRRGNRQLLLAVTVVVGLAFLASLNQGGLMQAVRDAFPKIRKPQECVLKQDGYVYCP